MANYLYNGVELPDINEVWNKETYPYAVITLVVSTGFHLILSDSPVYKRSIDADQTLRFPANTTGQRYYKTSSDTWEFRKDFYYQNAWSESLGGLVWTSHDILNEDGTVYLAASEPVLVGNYLTFLSANPFTLYIYKRTKNWSGTSMEYSTDVVSWTEWDGTTILESAEHNGEQKLYMRGTGNSQVGGNYQARFVLTGTNIRCIGNIENLLDYKQVANGEHPYFTSFWGLFNNCRELIEAPEIPILEVHGFGFDTMFKNCKKLTKAPALHATGVRSVSNCYQMFMECDSLVEVPDLPANPGVLSFNQMFRGCIGLKKAPKLPATALDSDAYISMFLDCTSLVEAPELPATTLTSSCYSTMFKGCTSLKKAPALPATTLDSSCYSNMFEGCTSLTKAPELPATTLASSCYKGMFKGCTSLKKAPALPAAALSKYCYESMFDGCTGLTQVSELPAATLPDYCYRYMFQGCTGIKLSAAQSNEYPDEYRIPTSGSGTAGTDSLTDMFADTGGTFTGTPEINTIYYTYIPIPVIGYNSDSFKLGLSNGLGVEMAAENEVESNTWAQAYLVGAALRKAL